MIAMLTGFVRGAAGASAIIVDVGGVGCSVTLHDRDRGVVLQRESVRLVIRTVMADSSLTLYGFLDLGDAAWFDELRGVDGVGCGTAMRLLSAMTGEALAQAIATADLKALQAVPGVGPRLASRIAKGVKL
jgi:Holliday junction DNA helicase RuvA